MDCEVIEETIYNYLTNKSSGFKFYLCDGFYMTVDTIHTTYRGFMYNKETNTRINLTLDYGYKWYKKVFGWLHVNVDELFIEYNAGGKTYQYKTNTNRRLMDLIYGLFQSANTHTYKEEDAIDNLIKALGVDKHINKVNADA